MTRVIVIAAGRGSRWGDYLGVPKHFAPVDGEPVIARTVRLFGDLGDTWIVGSDERYALPGTHLFVPRHRADHYEADRFTNNRELWSTEGRTLLLLGDVWFSDAAAAIIREEPDSWLWYCRFGASRYTGCERGEGFAFSFGPEHHALADAGLRRIVTERRAGTLYRAQGWELYRAMAGATVLFHKRDYGHAVRIDDWTQDFDYPEDYRRWLALRGHPVPDAATFANSARFVNATTIRKPSRRMRSVVMP